MTTARSSSRDPSIRNQAPEPARRPAPQPAAGSALQSSTSPSSAVQDRDEEDDAQNQYGNALVTRAASPALESADPVPADDSQLAGVLMSPATMFFAPFIPNIENESTGETDSDVVAEEEEEDEDEEGEIEEEQLESDESEGEAFVSEVADEDVGSEEEAGAPAEQPAVTPEDQRATEMREEQLPQAEPLLESGQAAVATEEETPAEDETPAEEEAVEVESESEAAAQSAESAEGAPERAVGEVAAPAAPEAPTIQAWRAGVRARTAAMPTPELGTAAEAPARVRRAGGAAASTYVAARADANTSAQQAVAPPPHVETPLPPPEPNPVPEATALVDKASDRRLPDQTLPGLQKSPRGSQPTMVALVAGERGTALVPQAPPPAEEDAAAVANPDQTRVDEIQGAAATAVQPQQAQGEPVTLVDQGAPPAPELPPASRSDVAGVIAVVLADVAGEARRMLQDAQREAFPRGLLLEAFPNIGDDIVPELEEELRTQLGEVARLAGISAEEVDAKVRERQETLAQRTEEARTDLGSAGTETNQCVATEAQSTLDATAGARDAVDEHIDLQTEAASGKVDPAVIRSRQQRLNRSISRKVGQQVVAYTQAGERRKKALDDSGRAAQNAYTATARREDQEIRAQVEAEGRTPEEARAESAPGYAWARDRVNEVRTLVADLQRDAGTTATTYESEVRTAGSDAHDLVRAWADAQVAEHSSWWDRLLEMFRNWAVQSHAESEAWEAAHNQAARDGLVRDLALMGTLQQLEANNIDGRALLGQAGITDEQRAVIAAYYGEGPDQGNPLVAIAAGLRARIAAQRRPDLIERFKQRVLDAPDTEWRNVALIGTAERAGFDAYTIASQAEEAMSGAGTTEELIFSALASLTPIQAAAVRKCYRAEEFGADLDADLASELGGEELRRAEALLAGDQALADVATLREAIEGAGTDEATIMQVLRGKSAEERQRIIALYNQTYDGDDLTEDLEGDLSDHDLDRANALLEGDTRKADAIALDQAMHGGVFGLGTDEDQITQVYTENRQEVEAEGARQGWTTAQIEAEVVRRNQQIEGAYETEYATGEAGERSALRQAFDDELSGPERNLALALADNDLVKADAARLEIERRGLYTDDDAVNEILRSQYQRARREVQRDLQIDLEQRAQIAALRGEEFDWEGERRTMQARIDTDSRERAAGYMTSLEDQYDSDYSTWGSGGLQVLIAFHMDGTARDEAQALLRNKGYLTPEEELFYAVEGPGTDEDRVRRVLTGKSPAEIQQIRDAWNAQHPDEPFDDRILGEFSGREDFDIQLKLEGEPQTPEERLARARRRLEYEQNAYLLGGAFAGPERGRLERQMAALERDEQRLSTMEPGSDEYARAMERFSLQEGYLDRAVSDHRRAVDSATDIAATIAGIVATVVVIVGAVALTIVTGGAAAPGLAAAIAAVMSSATVAATAAGAAAIATVLTKLAFKGGAYGYEDIGIDLAVGAVDAVAAYFTAGLGTKLLGGGTLSKLAGSKSFVPRLIANAAAEGAEGFASSLPSALTGSLANDQNWASGNSVGAIFGQTMVGVGMGTVLSGGLGSLGAIGKPARGAGAEAADVIGAQVQRRAGAETADVLARRGTPVERLAGWRAFRDANPGKAYDDFLRDLDAGIVARQGTDEAVRKLQRQMRGELLSSIPPAQRGQFKDVAIEVVSDADFQRLTRSAKGQAVVLIENGKPRVLLRESVDPRVLRQEGPHLLQTVDPRTAKKVAELDEARLANWDRLPIDEQFRLYRNKIDLEIDGQERLIRSLADDLDRAGADDVARRSLREQLETAQENLDQLTRRLDEVDSITPEQRVGMARGQPKPPQYLDQPPRLFAKKVTPRADPDAPRFHLDDAPSPWKKHLEPGERIHRVGDAWHEPPLPHPDARLYRQVEVLDTAGRIKKLRQEIEMPDGSWRQRGSESTARGSLVEEASLLLTQQRAARGTKTQIKSLGVKSQKPGGQGFDEVFFEFRGGKATVVVAEVKDYPGRYVPAGEFTAVTKNLDDNISHLTKQINDEIALPPSQRTLGLTQVELDQISQALDDNRFRLEIRLGPTTKLGTYTTGGRGGVIRTIKQAWADAGLSARVPIQTTTIRGALIEEAAALPANVKAHALIGTRPRFHVLTDSAASKKILTPPFEQGPGNLLIDNQSRLVSMRSPEAGTVTKESAETIARDLVDTLSTTVPNPRPPHMQAAVTVLLDVSRLSPEARKALREAIDDVVAKTHVERAALNRLHVVDDVP